MSLLFLVLHFGFICRAVSTNSVEREQYVSSIFESLGYSPACIASALASCERFAKPDCYLHVLYLMPELKALLQEIKCDELVKAKYPAISGNFTTDIYAFLEKTNKRVLELESEKQGRNYCAFDYQLKNITNTCAAIENLITSDLNKPILVEIKSLLQELKVEIKQKKDSSPTPINVNNKKRLSENSPDNAFDRKEKNCAEACGIRTVYPYEENVNKPVIVSCDQTIDGGGWTIIQNRDASMIWQNFYRSWSDYVNGFGDVNREFWLGLENIYALVNSTKMELRIDLEDFEGVKRWAKYKSFLIGDASTKYTLSISGYSGDAGDDLAYHNGMKFSTYDQDNDEDSSNCVKKFKGAWWHKSCHLANLNGFQHVGTHSSFADGINWKSFRGYNYSLKKSSMKVRPVSP